MIEVQTRDLKKGDHIVACSSDHVDWSVWSHGGGDVTTDLGVCPDGKFTFTYHSNCVDWPTVREGYLWWRVERADAKKVIGEFPGTCEFCGERAYVSAFFVDHQDETSEAALRCPAKRSR